MKLYRILSIKSMIVAAVTTSSDMLVLCTAGGDRASSALTHLQEVEVTHKSIENRARLLESFDVPPGVTLIGSTQSSSSNVQPSIGKAAEHQDTRIASQNGLDFITNFPIPRMPPRSNLAYLPEGSFTSWSMQDQQTVPARVMQACEIMWAFAHDNPATHFLPLSQAKDEGELGLDLCMAGHMPSDWPGRDEKIQAATAILGRARELGGTLELPPSLAAH